VARLDCLECLVDTTRLLVPVRDLRRVAECALTSPPPHAEPWVGGLAILDGSVCVSLALPGRPKGPLVATKGLLLETADKAFRYLVQVDEVRSLWTVDAAAKATEMPAWACPSSWILASVEAGESVLCLDTDAVGAWLARTPAKEPAGASAA
jgi:chemotaxis signal transduction protein